MQEEWREAEDKEVLRVRELLEQYCLGDKDAVLLCEDILYAAHIMDDIYDADKERKPMEVIEAFAKALGDIPNNPVYMTNVMQLAPLMLLTLYTWRIANSFQASDDPDKKLGSFILRNALLHVVYMIVIISGKNKGKPNWGLDVGEYFWAEFLKGYSDKYQEFLKEMEAKYPVIPIRKKKKKAI